LVELGLELTGVDTVLNVDEGIRLMRAELEVDEDDEDDLLTGVPGLGELSDHT
jgi:hypothetical protein